MPLPATRPPTDRERNVARLATAPWITADLAVRHDVLRATGGFDERFRRAYREDTEFHLRATAAGHRFVQGCRRARHPVGPAPWWISVAAQRGNADDALLRAIHGPAALDRGRRRRHQAITGAGMIALTALGTGRRRAAIVAGAVWLLGTVEFAWARIRPGPRTGPEIRAMVLTSIAIPPVACGQWLIGRWRARAVVATGDMPVES